MLKKYKISGGDDETNILFFDLYDIARRERKLALAQVERPSEAANRRFADEEKTEFNILPYVINDEFGHLRSVAKGRVYISINGR